jgi:UDP-glucose 4-epimerase
MHRSRELLLENLSVPLWIIRPTLIYGAGDTHNSYGPNRFMRQALAERCISLFGEGEETRSHIAVEDVVSLIIQGIKKQYQGLINAVTEPSYSFREMAESIAELMPFEVRIQTQLRKSPITHRHFDTRMLIQDFSDWEPMNIKLGLSRMRDQLSKGGPNGRG